MARQSARAILRALSRVEIHEAGAARPRRNSAKGGDQTRGGARETAETTAASAGLARSLRWTVATASLVAQGSAGCVGGSETKPQMNRMTSSKSPLSHNPAIYAGSTGLNQASGVRLASTSASRTRRSDLP